VHTYNQIILGWILGVALHFFFCHVVYTDLIGFVSKTQTYTLRQLIFNNGTFVFYAIYAIATFNFFYGDILHPVPAEWLDTTKLNCAKFVDFSYDMPETENFVRFNMASTIAGSYVGLIIEQRWMGTRKYKHFNKTPPFTTLLRVIVCTLIGSPCLAGIILCPKTGIHWIQKLLLKTVIPITLGNCYLFGFSKTVALKAGLMNTTVEISSTSEEENTDSSAKLK